MDILQVITQELGVQKWQVEAAVKLIDEGNTIPFISRYRKEATGALDEEEIRKIDEVYQYQVNLSKRKDDVIRLIDEKGLLTDELKNEIRNCRLVKKTDDLMRILPRKEYNAFPLKDKYQEIEFGKLDNNELVINFEFSNNGICNDWWYFSYSLIKMDYKLNINDKIIEKKNIFISPQDNEENNEIKYFEKDRIEKFKFRKSPFCVRNFPDYISTTMEFQNGINEFTLMNKKKYDFNVILDEINSFIDEKTRIKVEVRKRMKNKCKEFIECNYKTDNLLKYKIIQFFNRKK